jgi:hypothetical protein
MGNVLPMTSDNPDAIQVSFSDFWAKYPRRVAKKDAEKAWRGIEPIEHQKILRALEQQKRSDQWRREGGQYVPYAASWLRGERWTDELEGDLSMGECAWNRHGTREPGKPKCTNAGSTEKNGIVYCQQHGRLV